MKVHLGDVDQAAKDLLPPAELDGSGVGINYVDATLKSLQTRLEDGRKITIKRRGLKLTLKIGQESGTGLLRRVEHGPDAMIILVRALEEAAENAGATFVSEADAFFLELDH